jgi:hypothetical protein
MSVFVYVNTSEQVGTLRSSPTATRRPLGLRKTIRKAWRSSIGFWDDCRPRKLRTAEPSYSPESMRG